MAAKKTPDQYYEDAHQWRDELAALRHILLACGLDEQIKWQFPCYTRHGANVVGVGSFKTYFGLWFYQGALLADKKGVLVNAQEGKTKALRQWRMHSAKDIKAAAIKAYVKEAIALADAGKTVPIAKTSTIVTPPELEAVLAGNKKLNSAFDALTKGKQKEYAEFIAAAKRAETKDRRLEKITPLILAGVGLHDQYR